MTESAKIGLAGIIFGFFAGIVLMSIIFNDYDENKKKYIELENCVIDCVDNGNIRDCGNCVNMIMY